MIDLISLASNLTISFSIMIKHKPDSRPQVHMKLKRWLKYSWDEQELICEKQNVILEFKTPKEKFVGFVKGLSWKKYNAFWAKYDSFWDKWDAGMKEAGFEGGDKSKMFYDKKKPNDNITNAIYGKKTGGNRKRKTKKEKKSNGFGGISFYDSKKKPRFFKNKMVVF